MLIIFLLCFNIISNSNLTCGEYICDSENGKCIGNPSSLCFCNDQFDTYPEDNKNMCFYEKKKQFLAFIMESVGFGIGHIYTENLALAIPKLMIYVFACSAIIILRIVSRKTEENNPTTLLVACIACTIGSVVIIWHIIDMILYALNSYKDGNGIELLPWS